MQMEHGQVLAQRNKYFAYQTVVCRGDETTLNYYMCMIFAKKISKKMYTVFDDYMENDPNCGMTNRQKKDNERRCQFHMHETNGKALSIVACYEETMQ